MFTPFPHFGALQTSIQNNQNSQCVGGTSCFRELLKCKFCESNRILLEWLSRCHGSATCLTGRSSEKVKQTGIWGHSSGIYGWREMCRKAFLSLQCLAYQMSLQSSHQDMSVCICVDLSVWIVWENEHGSRASIVADMITCLDLSYGKNKTSISHYLPFNQIPTFFASPPQSCHRLKISPSLIREQRVQLILEDILFRNFDAQAHKKRIEKTPAPPIRQITSDF